MRTHSLLGLLLCFAACTTAPKKLGVATIPGNAQKILINGDDRIGTYVSKEDGFSTSSYWIEGPGGLILIDTQFLLSAANEVVDWAEKSTGKKVLLAIILHPNPDKFNGTGELQKRGIRVVTSQQVKDLIPEVHKDRHHWFYDRYKPDYPDLAPVPEAFGSKTTEITAGGVTLTAHVVGAGCSGAHVVVEYDRHLFVGDLVASLGHSWLELGLLDPWFKRIEELRKLKPTHVHPGRGPSGSMELLDREELYLKRVKKYVLEVRPRKGVSEEQRENLLAGVQKRLEAEYAGYSNTIFLEVGLPEVWSKLIR